MKFLKKVRTFCREMIDELKKASWPNWRELRESTVVVLLGIIFLGVFVGLVDFSLFQMVDLLMHCAGR